MGDIPQPQHCCGSQDAAPSSEPAWAALWDEELDSQDEGVEYNTDDDKDEEVSILSALPSLCKASHQCMSAQG